MQMSKWDTRNMLQSMMDIQRRAGVTISDILDKVVPEKYVGSAKLGTSAWHCDGSPVLICVYDINPKYRECIYCNRTSQTRRKEMHMEGSKPTTRGKISPL